MCGITGFLDPTPRSQAALHAICHEMADTLAHRGPDADGVWLDPRHGVGLGHRRLSIVDLSPTGAQPMALAGGRYHIVYNGEIYNTSELNPLLMAEGYRFTGTSDTETLLAAIEHWGLKTTLERIAGMWAFALWDTRCKTLHLVRDRVGIKPLYYGWMGKVFLFGSELKALRAHPNWRGKIDRDAVALQLNHSYIPAPWSIYERVYKLMPGCVLSLPHGTSTAEFSPLPEPQALHTKLQPRSYWDPAPIYIEGARHPFKGSADEAQEQVEAALRLSIRQRMLADVPLGAFLSGGIDSSVVVSIMQSESSRPVRTFSIGFEVERISEAHHAAKVAAHLGTDHTELIVTADEALSVVPHLSTLYDEPFSDSSQIPTAVLSRLTRQQVTVALSGDGGDEVFGGYNRYYVAPALWRLTHLMPASVSRWLGGRLQAVPSDLLDRAIHHLGPLVPKRLRHRAPSVVMEKIGGVIAAESPSDAYVFLTAGWKNATDVVRGSKPRATAMTDLRRRLAYPDFLLQMMHGDLVSYLPDDILVKVDRASMGASLEVRVPLLDHRLIELIATFPRERLLDGSYTKIPLRRLLDKYVPHELVDRPKQGFGVPLGEWLRGPLREWAEAQLDTSRLGQEGYFDVEQVRAHWEAHLSGRRDWGRRLWDVLMFQSWLERE